EGAEAREGQFCTGSIGGSRLGCNGIPIEEGSEISGNTGRMREGSTVGFEQIPADPLTPREGLSVIERRRVVDALDVVRAGIERGVNEVPPARVEHRIGEGPIRVAGRWCRVERVVRGLVELAGESFASGLSGELSESRSVDANPDEREPVGTNRDL